MMMLNELQINHSAIVKKVGAKSNIKKRLLDIGLVKGTKIIPILISPGKDMVAYFIKGAVIAIRKDDTEDIIVEEIK